MKVSIEPIRESDISGLVRIESDGVLSPLDEESLRRVVKAENYSCVVARPSARGSSRKIVGYALFTYSRLSLVIVSIAVAAEFRRMRVGTKLVGHMNDVAAVLGKTVMSTETHERREDFVYFLQSCKFEYDSCQKVGDGDCLWRFSRKVRK